jgi:Lar family restriction alleviation protein
MAEPLAPCPFCGGHIIDLFEGSVGGTYAAVMCRNCRATGPEGVTRVEAELLWNMRAEPQTTP